MRQILKALCILVATASPDIGLADNFYVQFIGDNVPKKVHTAVSIERANRNQCDPPCQLSQKETTFVRATDGTATIAIQLPADATRVCVQMWNDQFIDTATMVMKTGRRVKSELGGNLNADRKSACTQAQTNAQKAWGFQLTIQ